jgi:hypothetical protein
MPQKITKCVKKQSYQKGDWVALKKCKKYMRGSGERKENISMPLHLYYSISTESSNKLKSKCV